MPPHDFRPIQAGTPRAVVDDMTAQTAISFDAAAEYLESLGWTKAQRETFYAQVIRYRNQGRRLDLVAAEWDVPESVVEAVAY